MLINKIAFNVLYRNKKCKVVYSFESFRRCNFTILNCFCTYTVKKTILQLLNIPFLRAHWSSTRGQRTCIYQIEIYNHETESTFLCNSKNSIFTTFYYSEYLPLVEHFQFLSYVNKAQVSMFLEMQQNIHKKQHN